MNYIPRKFPIEMVDKIMSLYQQGMSSTEIQEALCLPICLRTIQRMVERAGLTRKDSFANAIKRGRVRFVKKDSSLIARRTTLPPGMRYSILERDGFRCVACGATARESLLEVDHKDSNPRNNNPLNLQTLCEVCNVGKPSPNRRNTTTFSGR